MIKPRVLFLCSGNSCRTQIAEAFLKDLASDRFDIFSAGVDPAPLDPEAVEAMRELGIEISGQAPKDVHRFAGQRFTYVISLCDREKERTCPIFPGAIWRQRMWVAMKLPGHSRRTTAGQCARVREINFGIESSNLSASINKENSGNQRDRQREVWPGRAARHYRRELLLWGKRKPRRL